MKVIAPKAGTSAAPSPVCANTGFSLNYNGSAYVSAVDWYRATPTGGVLLGRASTPADGFTFPLPAGIKQATEYYAQPISTPALAPSTVRVEVLPSLAGSVTASPAQVCSNSGFDLNYVGGSNVTDVRWSQLVNGTWQFLANGNAAGGFTYHALNGITQTTEFSAIPTFCSSLPTTYEAEDVPPSQRNAPISSAGDCVENLTDIGRFITFTVTVPQAGNYTVDTRYSAGSAPSDSKRMSLYVNDMVNLRSKVYFAGTNGWNNWALQSTSFALEAGTNTIKYQVNDGEGWINIDKIQVMPVTYQAEDAENTGYVYLNYSGSTGRGIVGDLNYNSPNRYVLFQVDVPVAGYYAVNARYAANGSSQRTMSVYVNDMSTVRTKALFPGTNAWDSWALQSTVVALQPGRNSIKYVVKDGDDGYINLDYVQVSPLATTRVEVLSTGPEFAGLAFGGGDVTQGTNKGTIQLVDYSGSIVTWQTQEAGGSWQDISQTGDEVSYCNLLTTTQFRALVSRCGQQQYSQSCTVRVQQDDDGTHWTEGLTYGRLEQLIGSSRNYFDQLGTTLQSQTKNLSQNSVLASQPLRDRYDRVVGSTLVAPIGATIFGYKSVFVTRATDATKSYDHQNFDTNATLNAPETVGNATVGTLGWYYSANNTIEPQTPITSYPYSRTEEAADGSTGVGRASRVGEVFRMGQNKENVQGNFPVRSELNNYTQLKNQYFPVSVAGEQLTTFKDIATQQVTINSNGHKAVSFQDKEGHILITARPGHTGDWLSVSNAVEIGWPHSLYKNSNELYENPVFEAASDIKVYDENFNLIFSGPARDFSGQLSSRANSCRIYSNDPFRIITGRIFNASTGAPLSWNSMYELPSSKREAYAFFNFYTFEAGKTTVTGLTATSDYVVTNSITGADVTTGFKNGTPIPAGLYQIRIIQGSVTLTYTNDYQDIAYKFYNQKGQLLGSLAPNGIKKLLRIDPAVTTGTASASLSNGLVTWLPFDEQVGATAADASGKGSNASLNGSSWAWKPTDGINNGALELTGTNYLKVPIAWQSSTFPTGSFTVSWWTKPYRRFAYNQMIATDCGCWGGFMFHTDWNGEVYVGTDVANRIALGANTVELNIWQQFTFSFSAGEGRLYKNGQLLAKKTGMAAPTAWQYLTLGTGGSNSSEGLLDEFRVYDRALSDADAKELYQAKLPFFTSYEYNTLGQLTALNETDAGRTEYVYRKDGQIRFSQNAKQRANNNISYTGYDNFGRPVESGECTISGSFFADAQGGSYVESMDYGGSGLPGYYMRSNIVRTTYDVANPVSIYGAPATGEHGVNGYSQDFLAGRVVTVTKFSSGSPYSTYTRTSQTWFSYDEQGRTKWVIRQQFNQVPHTLDYDYDFNGNVLSVCYNKDNASSRFTHYYSYDADQRLSEVRTNTAAPSDQATLRKLQASYSYYLHGPLKRVVIGGLQGMDYLYTAQGWLKSINGIGPGSDPAADGPNTTGMLADLFSQELEYYAGDYFSAQRSLGTIGSGGNYPDRFDGTIWGQVWRTPSRPTAMTGYGYRYDERGQLKQADYGALTMGSRGTTNFTPDPARFQEGNLTYDPNGNLGDLRRTDRFGNDLLNIKYEYTTNTNKLARVYNPLTPATSTISYTYDALGQLASQAETGKNKYFNYDVSGKVIDVYRAPGKAASDLLAHYDYDEFGQRIRQVVYDSKQVPTTTQYVRDAAGNEVASYYLNQTSSVLTLAEQPIYGASRIGVVRQPRDQEPGAELYELNDQLGNTRVVFQAPRTDTYLLTMENGRTDDEQKQFATPDATTYNSVRQSGYARQNSPNLATIAPYTPHYAMRLSSQVGPGKKLVIAPGDQVRLEVWAAYPSTPGGVINGVVAKPVTLGLLGGATLLTQTQPYRAEAPGARSLPAWQRLLSQVSVGVAIPLGTRSSKTAAYATPTPLTAPPNAVLRYTLRLVRDRSLVDQGTTQVPAAAEGQWQPLNLAVNVNIEEPAELEVWVQNLDTQYVYFDDLKIEHQVGALVAENHFYPYGQRNDALSWSRPSVRSYGRGYQGQDTRFDEETGYDNFELRLYDSRIGRWLSTDPMGQYYSPYVGMGNNPISNVDHNGGQTTDWYQNQSTGKIQWFDGSDNKAGWNNLGVNLNFQFVSFIDPKNWDGPSPPGLDATGDKLMTIIQLHANTDSKGHLLSVSAYGRSEVGETFNFISGIDYPGLPKQMSFHSSGPDSFSLNFERHVQVNPWEEFVFTVLGYSKVDVAQKLEINSVGGALHVRASTDIFPSARLNLNGVNSMEYQQPSYKATHGQGYVTPKNFIRYER